MHLRNLNQTTTMLHTSIPPAPGRTMKRLLIVIVAAGCGGDSDGTAPTVFILQVRMIDLDSECSSP